MLQKWLIWKTFLGSLHLLQTDKVPGGVIHINASMTYILNIITTCGVDLLQRQQRQPTTFRFLMAHLKYFNKCVNFILLEQIPGY